MIYEESNSSSTVSSSEPMRLEIELVNKISCSLRISSGNPNATFVSLSVYVSIMSIIPGEEVLFEKILQGNIKRPNTPSIV